MTFLILAFASSFQSYSAQHNCFVLAQPEKVAMVMELENSGTSVNVSISESSEEVLGFRLPVAQARNLDVGYGGEIWNGFELAPNPHGCFEEPNPYLAHLRMFGNAAKTRMVARGKKNGDRWEFTFKNLNKFYLEVKSTVPRKNAPDLSKTVTLECSI